MRKSQRNTPRVCPVCNQHFLALDYRAKAGKAICCSLQCSNKYRKIPAKERFLRFVPMDKPVDACWIWLGATYSNGYGNFFDGTGHALAHRFAWELNFGPIPPEMHCCHKCDVRACVNPNHLFIGSRADNMRDMVIKHRSASGERHYSHTNPASVLRGEHAPGAKLTNAQAQEIRVLSKAGGKGIDIAAMYGVLPSTISNILNGKTYA